MTIKNINMEFEYNSETYRVVYIEYHNKLPFSAIATNKDNGGYCTTFDFEFIYGDKNDIAYTWSGSGGKITEIQAPTYAKGVKGATYWIANDAKLRGKPKNIIRITEPYKIKTTYRTSSNPFQVATEAGDILYCEKCEHYMLDVCNEHQHWDDEVGVLRYNKDNAEVQ